MSEGGSNVAEMVTRLDSTKKVDEWEGKPYEVRNDSEKAFGCHGGREEPRNESE